HQGRAEPPPRPRQVGPHERRGAGRRNAAPAADRRGRRAGVAVSLLALPPSWGNCTTNMTVTPPANTGTLGSSCIAGANNADGSAVSLISAVSHDVEYLVVGASGYTISAGNGSTLLDILVDPAGGSSWSTGFIDDLLVGCSPPAAANAAVPVWYYFPIFLKAGTSIGAQARCAHTSTISGRVIVYAFGGNARPESWWCGKAVTSIGITAASSKGTDHTPGNSGAYSSWTNFGSTLPAPCGALQFGVHGTNSDTSATALGYYFEFGAGSTRIGPNYYHANGTAE